MDLSTYFQPWFRLGYYILLVPFKVDKKGGRTYISTNFYQKILCGILHIVLCVGAISEIHGILLRKTQTGDPALFLLVLQKVNSSFFCYLFAYTIWRKKDVVADIFVQPDQSQTKKMKFLIIMFTSWLFLASLFGYSSWMIRFDLKNLDLEEILRRHMKRTLSDFPFLENIKYEYNSLTQVPFLPKIILLVSFIARLYKWVLVDLLIGLTLISSYVCSTLGTEFYKLLIQHSTYTDSGECIVFEFYNKLKIIVDKLNDFMGPNYVVAFGSLITICAFNIVDVLDSGSWNFPIVMCYYFGMLFSSFIFAAHAHYKISHFKTWLLSRPKKSATTIMEYLDVENCNLGLMGGPLFTISYGFLGTASSVVLTYAIIMIQFRGTTSGLSATHG